MVNIWWLSGGYLMANWGDLVAMWFVHETMYSSSMFKSGISHSDLALRQDLLCSSVENLYTVGWERIIKVLRPIGDEWVLNN